MKKFALLCICGAVAAAVLTGCSGSDKLAQYKGVEVYVASREVSEGEVYAKVKEIMDANPSYVEVDRPAKEGDIVNIDYVGTQDGVEFAGGSGEGVDLTLGSHRFIEGFEEGLVGTKKGDHKELNLTFPETYGEAALAGQDVVFSVDVKAVKEKQDAVLDDAFVQRVSPFQTVDEFMADTKADLEAEKAKRIDTQKQQDVLSLVVNDSDMKLGRSEVSKRYNQELDNYTKQAKAFGTTLSGMAQSYGTDEAGLKQMIMSSVKQEMKTQKVIDAIAAQENLVPDDGDRQAFAELNGMDIATMVDSYGEETVAQLVKNYKVMKFLADNAVEKTAETAEGETAAAETTAAAEETTAEETTAAAEETTAAETTTAADETTAEETTQAQTESNAQ